MLVHGVKIIKEGYWWVQAKDCINTNPKLNAAELHRSHNSSDFSGIPTLLKKTAKQNGIYLDIGAAYGMTSIPLHKHFKDIYCFEPMPVTYTCLTLNKEAYSNIHCFNYAVSDKHGTVDAFFNTTHAMVSCLADTDGTPLLKRNDFHGKNYTKLKVPTITLDDFFPTLHVDCIKIDVENHELAVLQGAEQLLRRSKAVVIVESFNDDINSKYDHPALVDEFMTHIGYQRKGHQGRNNMIYKN